MLSSTRWRMITFFSWKNDMTRLDSNNIERFKKKIGSTLDSFRFFFFLWQMNFYGFLPSWAGFFFLYLCNNIHLAFVTFFSAFLHQPIWWCALLTTRKFLLFIHQHLIQTLNSQQMVIPQVFHTSLYTSFHFFNYHINS